MDQDILIHPRYFGPELQEVIELKLREIEGTCSGKYGFIIIVTSIVEIGPGIIYPGGFASYLVKYMAVVFRPFKDAIYDGIVKQVNKVGMFVEIGPLSCFISHNSVPSDFQFCPDFSPPCYKSEKETIAIGVEDKIRLKIVGVRVDSSGIFAIGTLMDDYLGAV